MTPPLRPVITVCLLMSACFIFAQPPLQWARRFETYGGFNIPASRGIEIATDAAGNIYSTGWFLDSIDADPGQGQQLISCGNNTQQTFVCKLSPSGSHVWSAPLISTGYTMVMGLEIDPSGAIWIAGNCNGNVDFDPGPGTFMISNNTLNVFLWKLDSNGNFLWAGIIDGPGYDEVFGLHIDFAGNPIVTGIFQGTADFDPGLGYSGMSSGTNRDGFVWKVTSTGALRWARQIRTTDEVIPYDVTAFGNGNIWICGGFDGTADFDPSLNNTNITSNNSLDGFILVLDSQGIFQRVNTFGGMDYDIYSEIELSPLNTVVLFGYFSGTTDLDPGTGISSYTASASNGDPFFCKLDGGSSLVWCSQLTGPIISNASSIAALHLNAVGDIYLTGQFSDNIDLDPGPGTLIFPSSGYNVPVLQYDSTGGLFWAGRLENISWAACFGITTDANDNVIVTGSFQDSLDCQLSSSTSYITTTGFENYMICKYAADVNSINEETKTNFIRVFPNPTTDACHIQSKNKINMIDIFDSSGRHLKRITVAQQINCEISLPEESTLYFLQITDESGEITTIKVSKQL